jgi:hypothetical protein
MVKYPTQPSPSLVTEVKYSSLTILHQSYSVIGGFYINHRFRREGSAVLRDSSKGGALEELIQFDLAKEKEIRGVWLLIYLGGVHNTFLGSSMRCFGGVLIYCVDGTISPRGRAQSWSGSTHGKAPSFIL